MSKPLKKFRIGYITANVWQNKKDDTTFYTVDLQRTYKDDAGEYQNTTSLNHSDLLNAAVVLKRAEEFIATL
jgi:hypothetical protein